MARTLRLLGLSVSTLLLGAVLVVWWLWNDRPDLSAAGLPVAAAEEDRPAASSAGGVHMTWLGVTTLLFDDGETRILTDGFFSRPGPLDVVLDRPVAPDPMGIERALTQAGISQLAAVVTVHSHYDHAMDTAEVARRTGALVLGSVSTANLARSAGMPEERIVEMSDGARRRLGRFTVSFVRSRHAPIASGGAPPFPGTIDASFTLPAPVSAWREGGSYSIVIAHPLGIALVQGSAGYVESALAGVRADVVVLGIGGLAGLGPDYAAAYWREVVERTGARRVFPVHFDDFTGPYGSVRAFPRALDDVSLSLGWLSELASADRVAIELLPFGRAVPLSASSQDASP
jgi:L-ascorbate metabolism protein UlaG (beta-lactamase superfamily)